jgi:hypothetical protein
MESYPHMIGSRTDTAESNWNLLYKIGGAAALFAVAMIPIQFIIFSAWSTPDTAIGWFALFDSNKLAGLLSFEGLFVVNAVFGIVTTLALYVALRRVNESLMSIALALGLVETIAFIFARPAIEMLYLSEQYAGATTDAQRALFLAAGETLWANFHGTAFHVGYNIFSVYFLIISLAMLRSNIFSKVTAYMGLLTAILNWGLYIPVIGLFLSMLSVIPLAIWDIAVARRLFNLGKGIYQEAKCSGQHE